MDIILKAYLIAELILWIVNITSHEHIEEYKVFLISEFAGDDGLLVKCFLHDLEDEVNIVWGAVVPHQSYTPHQASTRPQPAADLHPVPGQVLRCLNQK